jgi:hypothetical protein
MQLLLCRLAGVGRLRCCAIHAVAPLAEFAHASPSVSVPVNVAARIGRCQSGSPPAALVLPRGSDCRWKASHEIGV